MSHFSNLSTALSEKQRLQEMLSPGFIEAEKLMFEMKYSEPCLMRPGAVGVCLDDEGENIQLYEVDTIYMGDPNNVEIDVYPIGVKNDEDAQPRMIKAVNFWCLVDSI